MNYDDIKNEKLGFKYSKLSTVFRTWAPMASKLDLLIYEDANTPERKEYEMKSLEDGFWEVEVPGDLHLKYYTFLIQDKFEVTDPYSVSSSINSKRSVVIDMELTDPKGFKEHQIPFNDKDDAIIYEVHVKDFSYDETSGVDEEKRGKFLGMAQEGTSYEDVKTGLDHLEELGITHLHLMPIYDYLTVDENNEAFNDINNYNWGYDPELYNVPEGSYAVKPQDPISRVKELKELVMKAHEKGISVVMDVVYNHTYRSLDSNFNQLSPFYFYRMTMDNEFSNGSGCGNEFASEKPLARKFIVDSLKYWVQEYRIDGFRFDLMALMDQETVDIIIEELRKINPNILIYGEPWMAWESTLPINSQTLPGSQKGRGFSIFNSEFRDSIKGDNDGFGKGYIQGEFSLKKNIQVGIMGSIISLYGYEGLTRYPMESINYFNAHDNLIMADKLAKSLDPSDLGNFNQITKMAFNIIMLSMGLPFFHAGNEFSRSKNMDHNSYASPITTNKIDWSLKKKNAEINEHVKKLIHLRRDYSDYMLKSYEEMADSLYFIYELPDSVIGYTILGDRGMLLVVHNSAREEFKLDRKTIEEHITNCYRDVEIGKIKLIFDEHGDERQGFEETKTFDIPKITTYVYRLEC